MNDLQRFTVLDPARDREPTVDEWIRSRAMIDRTIAGSGRAPFRARFSVRRLTVGLTAAAALAVAGVVAAPALLPGTAEQAIASWTPVPGQLSGSDVMPEAEACVRTGTGGSDARTLTPDDVLIADQRGKVTSLIIAQGPAVMECLMIGAEHNLTTQGLASAETPPVEPGREHVTADTYWSRGAGDGEYSHVAGRIDDRVAKVEVTLPDGRTVRASAADGWWTAWWPGGEGGEADGFTIVVTLTDGTTASYRPSQI